MYSIGVNCFLPFGGILAPLPWILISMLSSRFRDLSTKPCVYFGAEGVDVRLGFERYEKLLHAKGYLDYPEILKEALSSLKQNVGLRERLKSRIRHVIVDEYQDVNPVQEAVIATLQKLGAKVCVVGDDDQTLYQWRGSDVSNILSFNTRYPDVTRAQMEENFRSSEGVVAVASQVIKRVVRRLPKEMKATTAQDFAAGDVVALPFDSPEEEAAYIAEAPLLWLRSRFEAYPLKRWERSTANEP